MQNRRGCAARWLRSGVHLCAITVNEVEQEVVEEADRVALHTRDFAKEQTFRPAGEPPTPRCASAGGRRRRRRTGTGSPTWPNWRSAGRLGASGTTRALFANNIGIGLQFAAVGARVYQAALSRGLGHQLPTDWFTESVHP